MENNFNHSNIPNEITNDSGATEVCISINNIPHLKFVKSKYICLQSWYESKHCFMIEIHLKGSTLKLEYNSLEKWEKILKLISEEV